MQKFADEWDMKLIGEPGFSIQGIDVIGLGGLLGYVSQGKHQTFNCFEAISRDFYAIDIAIIHEIRRPEPCGKAESSAEHDNAVQNLEDLRLIVRCIAKYFKLVSELGLPHPSEMMWLHDNPQESP